MRVATAKRPKALHPLFCNAQMGPRELRAYCTPSEEVKSMLRAAIQNLGLSARSYDRLLKVARTVADLESADRILVSHVAGAIQYRSLDRKLMGRIIFERGWNDKKHRGSRGAKGVA